ncbi:hypothetical protein EJB05_40965 [Eragrostis curvula]|uniref:B box-type domain-containing protein n=1 Tax=Eragrostis curvula TaxID=38414 RepID=A0A5J9TAK1_9POAL|nr:hypothetical protein EJB05_40965 [Eragrostis curvula]
MRVNCDVCGGEPAAVFCCADEAALCSACDRRANKLAGKHRRIPLIHTAGASSSDDSTTEGPLCDVCKERRGVVFCVEDRAILCADCDEPIHSANDLTAKHSRFLLVGAKLSAAIVDDQPPSSPHCGQSAQEQDSTTTDTRRSSVLECNSDNNGGGAMISDYLTNICPGWQVDDLLVDDSPPFATAATHKAGRDELEHVPSMDADLFDVVAGKRAAWGPSSWTGGADLGFEEVPTIAAMAAQTNKQGRVRETYWNSDNDSDVFAVPELTPPPAKKARPASFWCF